MLVKKSPEMQQYHKILLSLLWAFSKWTSSVPLDVESQQANLHSNTFIILPQTAESLLDNNDNLEQEQEQGGAG